MTDLDRQAFFDLARAQLEGLRERNPEEWERYREVSRTWQQGTDRDTLVLQDEPGWWE
ncbi:MAG TPA: hypothetical protein VFX70_00810 [Mycobacteriales bacterium]|nr:hypothetical protein [Mycobacteriales bacterium]